VTGDVFHAISHPTRRGLLDALRSGSRPVRDLATEFDASRPAISQHLRILLGAGLVSEQRVGRQNLYQLEAARLATASEWLSGYERFWNDRLLALRTTLDSMEDGDT
jgi:DNA-binding transcriptional ArsR family regulator